MPGGGGTRIRNDGYVRLEIGGLENNPYGDSWRHEMRPLQRPNRKFWTPYTDFQMQFLNGNNCREAPQAKIFLNYDC